MKTIFRKELADYFGSVRFLVLLIFAVGISAWTLYVDLKGIRASAETDFIFLAMFTTEAEGVPSLFNFVNLMALFFIPIIGIVLGFDAVNTEKTSGTLSRVLSQPIYRDSVINGKFLAGIFILAMMVGTIVLLISGFGLYSVGVPPAQEEILRLFIYMFYAVAYGAFWMGLSILLSVIFTRTSSSLLIPLGIWLFGIIYLILLGNIFNPMAEGTLEAALIKAQLQLNLLRLAPHFLFAQASDVLLQPPLAGSFLGILGIIASEVGDYLIIARLSLGQTLLLVWPHLTTILGLTIISFGASYVVFMRQEIRST